MSGLRIGGWEKFSVVDWPGRLVTTVFCQGCGWRCGYCHNAHLIPFRGEAEIAWEAVLEWLPRRRGLLDGVVFSGGEPTLQAELPEAMREVRALGFGVGLHTGGPVPEAFARVLPLVDWVGFDFKAPWKDYAKVTGRDAGEAARESLRMVRAAGVACEVRTTWHPLLLSEGDVAVMAEELVAERVEAWTVQRFRSEGCVDAVLCAAAERVELPAVLCGRRDLTVALR